MSSKELCPMLKNELLKIKKIEKSFDGIKALSNFSCSLNKGEILGLIGPNGAGKTTLLNVICGYIPPDRGQIIFKGLNLIGVPPYKIAQAGIARTFQLLRVVRHLSVLDNVLLSFRDQHGERLRNIFFRLKNVKQEEKINREQALLFLQGVGLSEKANDFAENLSYGQQKLLSIACCQAAKGDILLLDEPVAGIAPEMIETILQKISDLQSKGKSVVFIEHNLDAVMEVCDRLIFMNEGVNVSEGTPEEVRNDPKVLNAYIE